VNRRGFMADMAWERQSFGRLGLAVGCDFELGRGAVAVTVGDLARARITQSPIPIRGSLPVPEDAITSVVHRPPSGSPEPPIVPG